MDLKIKKFENCLFQGFFIWVHRCVHFVKTAHAVQLDVCGSICKFYYSIKCLLSFYLFHNSY